MILKYSDFILNETLKTHDIDDVISLMKSELSLMYYDFSLNKSHNKIEIILHNIRTKNDFPVQLDNLNNLMTDRHGWFPSKIFIKNWSGMESTLIYDRKYLIDNFRYFEDIKITYEPKFDLLISVPNKLYHVSFNIYEDNIIKKGLIPKSKNKLTYHLDRVYLSETINDSKILIPQLKFQLKNSFYGNIKMRNVELKWILLEIDTNKLDIKLYKDPNSSGYYTIDNIPPNKLKIIDREK